MDGLTDSQSVLLGSLLGHLFFWSFIFYFRKDIREYDKLKEKQQLCDEEMERIFYEFSYRLKKSLTNSTAEKPKPNADNS